MLSLAVLGRLESANGRFGAFSGQLRRVRVWGRRRRFMGVGEAVEGGCASRWGGSSGRHYITARISRVRVVTQEQEAFAKARKALAEKRAQKKEEKAKEPKPRRGRPPTKKPARVVYEAPSESSESSSEEEVVYVQRRKPKPKQPKPKKQPRVVYVTDSDDEEEEELERTHTPPQENTGDWFNFV